MKFRHWLRRSYKKEDGKRLNLVTVIQYDRQYKKLNAFYYRESGKNISELSISEAKDLLGRLQADTTFQQLDNAQIQCRVLELYIMFKERNI